MVDMIQGLSAREKERDPQVHPKEKRFFQPAAPVLWPDSALSPGSALLPRAVRSSRPAMRALLPLLACCISLWSPQQLRLLAVPLGSARGWDYSLVKRPSELEESVNITPVSSSSPMTALPDASIRNANAPKWKLHLLARILMRKFNVDSENNAVPAQSDGQVEHKQRASRGRRHARAHSHHHPKLMRVGCVLGTCQVQNLSHRLYQLIGQSGREDSSPINPDSPHSYG
ncbi:ADM2-like [Arapaima gigas]